MSWSLNEIEGLARKAARGSGQSWGLAEETGKTARWLASAGLPGSGALAGLLAQNDGVAYEQLCPAAMDGPWQAKGGTLCPLIAGTALCDRAHDLADGHDLTLQDVAYPLLLVPFVAAASEHINAALTLRWGDVMTTHHGDKTWLSGTADSLSAAFAARVHIGAGAPQKTQPIQRMYRGEIAPHDADILMTFAHRTYAPDTPESRLAGAGADASDND